MNFSAEMLTCILYTYIIKIQIAYIVKQDRIVKLTYCEPYFEVIHSLTDAFCEDLLCFFAVLCI